MNEYDSGLLTSALGAKLPWKSVDAELSLNSYSGDTQEQIDKCLSCRRLACTNCLYVHSANKPRKMKVLSGQITISLWSIEEVEEM